MAKPKDKLDLSKVLPPSAPAAPAPSGGGLGGLLDPVATGKLPPKPAPAVTILGPGAGQPDHLDLSKVTGGLTGAMAVGAKGDDVKGLQRVLANAGFYKGAIDGDFGPQTEAALKAFQQANNLPASGTLDTATDTRIGQILQFISAQSQGGGTQAPAAAAPSVAGNAAPAAATTATDPLAGLNDAQVDQYIHDNFPQMVWMLQDPELRAVLKRNVTEGWFGDARFVGALEQTQWWKTHAAAERLWDQMIAEDPGQAKSKLDAAIANIGSTATRLGITLDPKQLNVLADQSIRFGWDDNQLRHSITAFAKMPAPGGQAQGGDIGAEMTKLRGQAEGDYMVPVTDATLFDWAKRIAAGDADEAQWTRQLVDWAKGRFPQLAQQIDAGQTPKSFFGGITQQTAKLLGRDPAEIDLLNDPKWSRMTEVVDDKGQRRPMTLSEAGVYVRQSPDFQNAPQGLQTAAQVTNFLTDRMGGTAG